CFVQVRVRDRGLAAAATDDGPISREARKFSTDRSIFCLASKALANELPTKRRVQIKKFFA
ncbi:MAG: hypothetical protein PVJ31_08900, partial [Methyloceanibacter sp.]